MLKSPPSDSPRLHGEVRRVADLTPAERQEMRALLARYFENVSEHDFARDLGEKEWAILLREKGASTCGAIRGFSTLMRLEAVVDGEEAVAFFSGDTIIERGFWGETLLPRLWSRLAFDLAREVRSERPRARVYWFLIASGYKTYRFLPVFFRDFWPRAHSETPPRIVRVLQVLGARKFGAQFDAERGVVRFERPSPLREGVAEISDEKKRDADVAFFARANPGHARGDELACLCEISEGNLSAAGRRMLGI